MSEKNQKPTSKKLEDTRKKGQVPKSEDLSKVAVLAGVAEVGFGAAHDTLLNLQSLLALPLQRLSDRHLAFGQEMAEVSMAAVMLFAKISVLSVGAAVMFRILSSWLQFGVLFVVEPLKPSAQKINPVSNLKSLFGAQKLLTALLNVPKAFCLGFVLYLALQANLPNLLRLPYLSLEAGLDLVLQMAQRALRLIILPLAALGVGDYLLQRHFYMKRLRMSHEDIKQEHKQSEGDPKVKRERKKLAKEMLNKPPTPKPGLANANLLVVNPTHYAVGLLYSADITPLPVIECRGEDEQALSLIDDAHELGVPVIKSVWLARRLYKEQEGGFIPRDTLLAVAQLYRLVRELDEVPAEVIEAPQEH